MESSYKNIQLVMLKGSIGDLQAKCLKDVDAQIRPCQSVDEAIAAIANGTPKTPDVKHEPLIPFEFITEVEVYPSLEHLGYKTFREKHSGPIRPKLPPSFWFLLPRSQRESFVGDMEERFVLIAKRDGQSAATRWFYREVTLSFISLAFAALKRFSGLERLFRRV
jgi:hypothetical protein